MLEREYQARLIKEIERRIPGCVILKNDSGYLQGVPDLLILFGPRWAMLEVKKSEKERVGPNQAYYIEHFDSMSYASFVYPENEEQVLYDLQLTLQPRRSSRVS